MQFQEIEAAALRQSERLLTVIPGLAVVRVFDDLRPLEDEWRGFERTAAGHVFQTFDFVSAWLQTVGRARQVEPRIVVGRDLSRNLVFILPLGVRPVFGVRHLEWLGGEHADYHCGLFDRRFLAHTAGAQFAEAVIDLLSADADVCNFRRQPLALDGLANPFAAYSPISHSDASHETRLATQWDAYYRAKRNSSSRRHDRGKLQRLQELGGLRINVAPSRDEIAAALAMLFQEKERSLTAHGVSGFFSDPVKRFYRAVAERPYPDGPCHVATVESAGSIVAVNWGLVRGSRYYYVMHAYAANAPAAPYSPGRILMYALMQWCIERGIATFDFTIGDEEFKSQWCETSRPLADSVAAINSSAAPLAFALRTAKAAKRFIKQRPALLKTAHELRRRLPSAKPRPQLARP